MNQDALWDFYQNVNHPVFELAVPRLQYLLKFVNKNEKVLNIGVGNGALEQLAVLKKINIHSLDPSEATIEKLRKTYNDQERFKVGYAEEMPFPTNYFDSVIISEVIEHLDSTQSQLSLSEIRRVLKNDGKIIGTVPFDENLVDSQVVCPKCSDIFHRWGHQQTFNCDSIKILLGKYFDQIKVKRKLFIPWNCFNKKEKLVYLARLAIFYMNVRLITTSENIFFIGVKH